MPSPTSIRLDDPVITRLASYVARHPGVTRSSAVARYVDEGLRMDEHPGVLFREGPAGRRASVVGGPDVWEVVRAVRTARAVEPELSDDELVDMLEDNTGVSSRMMRAALGYWAAYPDEVDAMIQHAERAESEGVAADERTRALLQP